MNTEASSNSQRIAKNTFFLFIRMLLVLFVRLYTSRVVLQVLGFEDFGIYNVVGSIVVFFSFLNSALSNASYRFLAYELGTGDRQQLNRIYSMAINSHILLAVFVFIVLEAAGVWFIDTHLVIAESRRWAAQWVFQFSLLGACLKVVQAPFDSNILVHEKMNFYALVSIVEVVLNLALVYMLFLWNVDKLVLFAFLNLVVSLCVFVAYGIYCRIKLKDCVYMRFWDSVLLRKLSTYSGWSLLVNCADGCTRQSMSIFFNLFLGIVANAALGIANQVMAGLGLFVANFTKALKPQIIKSFASRNYDYFMKLIFSSSKISHYLLLLVCLPAIMNIEFILKIWLGDYPPMTPNYIRAIILYSFFDTFQTSLWQAVHATGQIRTHQILMGFIKILAIPFMYIILKMGYSGTIALLVWSFLNLVCAIVRTLYMQRLIHLPLSRYLKEVVGRILLVTGLSIFVPYFITQGMEFGWNRFFISSGIAVGMVVFSVFFIGLNRKEKQLLLSFQIVKRIKAFRF